MAEKPKPRQELLVKPEATVVLPSWYAAHKDANERHPQRTYGIRTLAGRAIMHSLQNGETDLASVARSAFTPEQLTDLAAQTARMHRVYGIPIMPEGFAQEGERTFPLSDLSGLWEGTRTRVVQSIVYSAADKHPAYMDIGDLTRNSNATVNNLAYSLNGSFGGGIPPESSAMQERLQEFSESAAYLEVFPVLHDFYIAAGAALETKEAKDLARRRRDVFSGRKPEKEKISPLDYELHLVQLMSNAITEISPDTDRRDRFFTVMTDHSLRTLAERVPYAHHWTKED